MSFGSGGGAAPAPKPEPVVPVPQADDPKSVEQTQRNIKEAQDRQGYEAALLSGKGSYRGDTSDPHTEQKKLTGIIG